MQQYLVRYISGPQGALKATEHRVVMADNVDGALRQVSQWPIERSWDQQSGWAKNPGTSLYHVEAWEAELAPGTE
ncbi:hypothetical protein [Fundidesulfovibrio agrisoli]|uniref:hypothetical protein n=1 Tax=Fundidesulfovibrio agrisoli TaxID=2922717 RepID=UPI001FACDC22|nr:hypothetical protein [Fundidesulfovibrio agrisoli]